MELEVSAARNDCTGEAETDFHVDEKVKTLLEPWVNCEAMASW
jgi:hypothetical protein